MEPDIAIPSAFVPAEPIDLDEAKLDPVPALPPTTPTHKADVPTTEEVQLGGSQEDELRQLRQRVVQLEKENKVLKQQLESSKRRENGADGSSVDSKVSPLARRRAHESKTEEPAFKPQFGQVCPLL